MLGLCVSMWVWVCVPVRTAPAKLEEGVRASGAGVTGGREPSQGVTLVLCKMDAHSYMLSFLSSALQYDIFTHTCNMFRPPPRPSCTSFPRMFVSFFLPLLLFALSLSACVCQWVSSGLVRWAWMRVYLQECGQFTSDYTTKENPFPSHH